MGAESDVNAIQITISLGYLIAGLTLASAGLAGCTALLYGIITAF